MTRQNLRKTSLKVSSEQLFLVSALLVNGGNYLYNLLLGRILGPANFADAAVLITFLLVLSFLAMTFQLVTAKFITSFKPAPEKKFIKKMYQNALIIGLCFGFLIIVFAQDLQTVFKTSSVNMFIIFGLGVPVYFLMSVNRGIFQGKKDFKFLAITYQTEMLSRLGITLLFIFLFDVSSPIVIALGILLSFFFGLFPINLSVINIFKQIKIEKKQAKKINHFFIITAFYELSQIVINNSDILLVKHYFNGFDAGLYASLALIGRVVYFIAWMFVLILLPTVIQLKKENKATTPTLFKYLSYISIISFCIISVCYIFPEELILLLFGKAYLPISNLLWKYALATGIFAIANIFTYYFLSLDQYVPVVLSGVFGILQIIGITIFHHSTTEVVHVQIITMILLLILQLTFFLFDTYRQKRRLSKSMSRSA
jgi:O-antigen/teichoic acid export membrane protein